MICWYFKMAGTKAGGLAAAATNKAKYGANFYANIGKVGGQRGRTGGFYGNPELARTAGVIGGRISKRGAQINYRPQPTPNWFQRLFSWK